MHSKEQENLRSAIANFLGVAASTSMYEGDRAKENVIALFTEELVKIGQNKDQTVNMQVLKPIFLSVIWILKCRKNDIISSYTQQFNGLPP